MDELPLVTILMATYNGDKFLAEQLESILSQQYKNWELVIRDDDSTDSTQNIISDYVNQDSRIKQITFGNLHGTACRNFSQLFDWAYQHKKQYILFADQDDIWLPDKIEQCVIEILAEEKLNGYNTPLAKYSNFKFIDDRGNLIDKQLKLPSILRLQVLLNENYAWGCTMILNQAAINVVKHIPSESVNHDYYIALVLTTFGKISLIGKDLVLYRQHQANVSGNVKRMSFASRFNRYFKNSSVMIRPLTQNYALVKSFYERYSNELSGQNNLMISSFLNAYKLSFLSLLIVLFKFRIFKIGLGKNVVYLYTLFLYRRLVVDNINNSFHK